MKGNMKKLIAIALITIGLALSAPAQTLNTNTETPTLEGPFIDLLTSISTWTNLTLGAYGIYDTGTKAGGAGVVALYNATPFIAGGVGLQYLNDELWMPSGQVQFQAPFTIAGKVKVTPLAFTGIGTPIAGGGDRNFADNHSVVGIFGAGLAVRTTEHLDLFVAAAKWTSFEGEQWYFGLAYRF